MSGLNSHLWSQHSVACAKFMNITINLSSSCARLIIYDGRCWTGNIRDKAIDEDTFQPDT